MNGSDNCILVGSCVAFQLLDSSIGYPINPIPGQECPDKCPDCLRIRISDVNLDKSVQTGAQIPTRGISRKPFSVIALRHMNFRGLRPLDL